MVPRIIPLLLLQKRGLVKGIRFGGHTYIGDPLNAVRIFNKKEVDELVFIDIEATRQARPVSEDFVRQVSDECYMPFCVGGGIRSLHQIERLLGTGAEKVCICSALFEVPGLLHDASRQFGSQSLVAAIDIGPGAHGASEVFIHNGTKSTASDPRTAARMVMDAGAGEILLTSIEHDGTRSGFDCSLIRQVADAVTIPVIACGGAGSLEHIKDAIIQGHASAAALGSMCVFWGNRRAVMIQYPRKEELTECFGSF
jgi:cyclase